MEKVRIPTRHTSACTPGTSFFSPSFPKNDDLGFKTNDVESTRFYASLLANLDIAISKEQEPGQATCPEHSATSKAESKASIFLAGFGG